MSILSDAKLIQGLKKNSLLQKNEAELIFFSISSVKAKNVKNPQKEHGKLNFAQFFQALELIAQKIYPQAEGSSSLKILIQNNLTKLKDHTYENEIRALQHMLKDTNMLGIVHGLGQALLPYIRYYFNEKNQMNFDQFLNFCTDFSVFPDLISKTKLTSIFYSLAATYAKNTMILTGTKSFGRLLKYTDDFIEPQFINFELFIDCIAICALETISINRTPEEKIGFAIEKITQSTGAANISLKSGYTRSFGLEKSDYLLFLPNEINQNNQELTFVHHLFNKPSFNS